MTYKTKFVGIVCFAFYFLVTFGCGEPKPDGFPKIYPVKAHVTQEGKSLAGASLSFLATDGSTWSIGGSTDESGMATLTTHGKYVGAPLGTFKVIVMKQVSEGEDEYNAAMNRQDSAAAAKIDVKVFSYVQDIYNSPKTTPVEVTIDKGTKVVEIDAGPIGKLKKEFLR